MDDKENQLVRTIAHQVLAALRQQGMVKADAGASPSSEPRAQVQPPIGTCTGDYSKFPELAGRLHSTPQAPAATADSPAQSMPQPLPLTGIITASQLEAAMKASPDGVALLAADARLTPLANDLARQHANLIRRANVSTPGSASMDPAGLPWLWWIDGSCRVAQQVAAQRQNRLRMSNAGATPNALANVVRELAGAIKIRRVAGGILFVHNAARAACFANRCSSIRAVVGTCGEAAEQGITELGANVLIVEYPHHGERSMAAMVDRFLQQPPQSPPAVERDLADLHRCG